MDYLDSILTVRISEIFHSIQGEGEFAGTPSVFVRTTGCNLRCWFCDTPYTSIRPEGTRHDWREILQKVLDFDCLHVVLTGGEPLLQPEIVPFAKALRDERRIVTIETAGTIFRPALVDLMSISPKLANSTPHLVNRWFDRHERDRDRPDALRQLMRSSHYQLKFVVDQPIDLDEIVEYLKRFPDVATDRVWVMPQGICQEELNAKKKWLQPQSERLGFRFCPRQHIELFGNIRGT